VTPREEIWVDMTQFDTEVADAVWDGTHRDRSAPPWYRDVRALIHRARGPAEAHELADEPAVVEAMGRTARGQHLAPTQSRARATRPSGVHTLGRVVAMKAAAATTATLIGVTAAAAATTGIVATVAATVVVPAVRQHVVPFIGDRLDPTIVDGTGRSGAGDGSETHGSQVTPCHAGDGDDCGTLDPSTAGARPPDASAPAEMPVVADPSPAQSPADELPPVEQNPVVPEAESAEPEAAADATAEEATTTTTDSEPLDATTVEPPPPVDPAPDAGTAPEPGPGDEHEAPDARGGKTTGSGDHGPEQGGQTPATDGSFAGD
jgi:hypothetical protein